MLLSVDSLRGGDTLLRGSGGDGGGGGTFIRRGGVVGGGALFVLVQFLLLCRRLFQVSVRAGNFALSCSRHQIS